MFDAIILKKVAKDFETFEEELETVEAFVDILESLILNLVGVVLTLTVGFVLVALEFTFGFKEVEFELLVVTFINAILLKKVPNDFVSFKEEFDDFGGFVVTDEFKILELLLELCLK